MITGCVRASAVESMVEPIMVQVGSAASCTVRRTVGRRAGSQGVERGVNVASGSLRSAELGCAYL